MTTLFLVLFMEQMFKEGEKHSVFLGLGLSMVCLWLFGGQSFMIPAMLAIVAALTFLQKPLNKEARKEGQL